MTITNEEYKSTIDSYLKCITDLCQKTQERNEELLHSIQKMGEKLESDAIKQMIAINKRVSDNVHNLKQTIKRILSFIPTPIKEEDKKIFSLAKEEFKKIPGLPKDQKYDFFFSNLEL